ncbi:DUF805 domain-containing protein [Deinococcus sp. QL22]|uniref:DUF805 domain-containing protein n=1 Tax=Deinococcus sp. QL22 TaxID=2939437 RepID=UPI002017600F|nr:DUF805 domain-containing protein [Deinococcus sp. QL22]UQN10708.1 DUF805 domain-containing protein [Deinococcus sp. QL22]
MKEFVWVMTTNYANLRGRARRREYWMFTLVVFILAVVIALIEAALGLATDTTYGPLSVLLTVVTFIPTLAVSIRRMHDTGRSGWWAIVPILILVLACFDSEPGTNRWGSNPKEKNAVPTTS